MKLDKFYSLRADFTVIGLTGRVGSGCSEVAKLLVDEDFPASLVEPINNSIDIDDVKYKICYNYVKRSQWQKFSVIEYKNVLLLHVLYFSIKNKTAEQATTDICELLVQNGKDRIKSKEWENRFDNTEDKSFLSEELIPFLQGCQTYFVALNTYFGSAPQSLYDYLKDHPEQARNLFFGLEFNSFAKAFYRLLNKYSIVKRSRFTHDLANNLRLLGQLQTKEADPAIGLEYIYTIANTINRLIKAWRTPGSHNNPQPTKLVIDALKNSLELMYFKEKYAAFYMVATKRTDEERKRHVTDTVKGIVKDKKEQETTVEELIRLDKAEYKANDFKSGLFASPDVENCIQKSDYHIFIDSAEKKSGEYRDLNWQILKLVALIGQPGIITPSTNEHFMQVAYNAKFNSGCISRQVGAVVTDENYSIKAIGWNDVPEHQMPCSLRNINDLIGEKPGMEFSNFEKNDGYGTPDRSFRLLAKGVVEKATMSDLKGRNCSFCFKSFHNAFEDDKNQVHTRSLHAEENAMLQITKFGGQGIKEGNLYTTASPCELCSKKAYQLGIRKIFYIDPYPGIARTQVLEAGTETINNPKLIMFQGAVGRAFHKLYEPFMAYKDEISILTGIKPEPSLETTLKRLVNDDGLREKILKKLDGHSEEEKGAMLNNILTKAFS